jgi:hypothetical protein
MIYGMMNASRRAVNYDYNCGKFPMISRRNRMTRIDDSDEATE